MRSQSASPTPSEPDLELEAQFRARLASIYGPPSYPAPETSPYNETSHFHGDVEVAEKELELEFEFRLFSTTAPGKPGNEVGATAQKIILVDEEEEIGHGGFVVPERNRGYYFAEKAGGERKLRFKIMALSGEEVLSRARKRAWGLEVPWRVRVLNVAGKHSNKEAVDIMVGVEEGDNGGKKKRPGKQRRILLRERKKSREKAQEQKKAEKEKKEEAEREKRTRRNREKKVKRKLKEKAKKACGGMEDANDGAMDLGGPLVVDADDQASDQ